MSKEAVGNKFEDLFYHWKDKLGRLPMDTEARTTALEDLITALHMGGLESDEIRRRETWIISALIYKASTRQKLDNWRKMVAEEYRKAFTRVFPPEVRLNSEELRERHEAASKKNQAELAIEKLKREEYLRNNPPKIQVDDSDISDEDRPEGLNLEKPKAVEEGEFQPLAQEEIDRLLKENAAIKEKQDREKAAKLAKGIKIVEIQDMGIDGLRDLIERKRNE